MAKQARFEGFRFLGDKRNQRVYDLDRIDDDPAVAAALAEIVAAECFATFAPDTLAEARNRGYRAARSAQA